MAMAAMAVITVIVVMAAIAVAAVRTVRIVSIVRIVFAACIRRGGAYLFTFAPFRGLPAALGGSIRLFFGVRLAPCTCEPVEKLLQFLIPAHFSFGLRVSAAHPFSPGLMRRPGTAFPIRPKLPKIK